MGDNVMSDDFELEEEPLNITVSQEPLLDYKNGQLVLITSDNANNSFKSADIEYKDILTIEQIQRVEKNFKSVINEENLETRALPSLTLTTGTYLNDSGLFITPVPNPNFNNDLHSSEKFSPVLDEFKMTRLMMNNKEEYSIYYDNLPDFDNKAVKEGYEYKMGNWFNYSGDYWISLFITMQNILQVKFKRVIGDKDYEITFPFVFEHYDLMGLTSYEIYSITVSPTLVDVQQTSGWWRTIGHTVTNPTYSCVIRTYDCSYYVDSQVGWTCATSAGGRYCVPGGCSDPYTGANLWCQITQRELVQKTCQEYGTCGGGTTTTTNAAFTTPVFPVKSDTAEIIIENGSLGTSATLHNSSNDNIGSVTVTGNKYITLNNRGDGDYRIHLTTSSPNANWFTNLFVKNTYENIDLLDVSYEINMVVKHGLSQSEVNNLVNADNNNRNIYRNTINITNFQWADRRLKKLLRHNDYRNIVFVLKEEKIVLNHRIENGKILIELPNKFLTPDKNIIDLLILPLDYEHESIQIDPTLSNMPLMGVEYVFPGDIT